MARDNVAIMTCVQTPRWFRQYYFFSEQANSTDVYAIKTNWVVRHNKLIKRTLVNHGVFIYEHNPSSTCDWIINYNYDWPADAVIYKGNASQFLDSVSRQATGQSTGIEWALIFIWLWGGIAIALLGWLIDTIKSFFKASPEQKVSTPDTGTSYSTLV